MNVIRHSLFQQAVHLLFLGLHILKHIFQIKPFIFHSFYGRVVGTDISHQASDRLKELVAKIQRQNRAENDHCGDQNQRTEGQAAGLSHHCI